MKFNSPSSILMVIFGIFLVAQAGTLEASGQESSVIAAAEEEVKNKTDGIEKQRAEATAEAEAEVPDTRETDGTPKATHKTDLDEKVAAYNEDKKDDDMVICRREKRTGSHFSRTRCVTRSQAKREREDAQEALQRAQRGASGGRID